MKSLLRFVIAYVLLSGVLGLLALVSSFPARPSSWVGWAVLFALVIPVNLAGELVGEVLHRNRVARAVARRTEGSGFSWLRLAYLLLAGLVIAAALLGVILLVSPNV
jgi:hypothetical protein